MRRLIWVLAALPVILIAAAFIVPLMIDWTDHRQRIEAAVAEATGLTLEVRGGIAVTLLPQPSLRLQEVVWSGPQGEIAGVPQIDAELALGALLQGEARVERLTLIAPEIASAEERSVLTAADNLLSAPLLDSLQEIEIAAAAWTFAPKRRLVIDRLLIGRSLRNERVAYSFDLLGEAWQRPLTAKGRLEGLGACEGPFVVEAALEGLLKEAQLSGQWRCDAAGLEATGLISAAGPDVSAVLALALPAEFTPSAGPAMPFILDGPLAWQDSLLDAPALSLGLGQQEAELRLTYEPVGQGALSGELRMPLLDLDGSDSQGLEGLARQLRSFFEQAIDRLALDLVVDTWRYRGATGGRSQARLDYAEGKGRVLDLALSLPNASQFHVAGTIPLSGEQAADAKLSLSSEDLRGLLAWLAVPEALVPKERLRSLEITAQVIGSLQNLRLQALQIALDSLRASGEAALPEGLAGPFELSLAVDVLNLDAYGGADLWPLLPALAEGSGLDLNLTAGQVTLEAVTAEGLSLAARLGDGAIDLEELAFQQALGARVSAVGKISPAQDQVLLDLELEGPLASLPSIGTAVIAAGDYRLEANLDGALSAPALAGQLDALGGQLLFSGLLAGMAPTGDWAVSLLSEDLNGLLQRLDLPIMLASNATASVELSGLLRFGNTWSVEELVGRLGPLAVLGGSFHSGQGESETRGASLSLALDHLDLDLWDWSGQGSDAFLLGLLDLAGDGWSLAGEQQITLQRVSAQDLELQNLALRSTREAADQAQLHVSGNQESGEFQADLQLSGATVALQARAQDLPIAQLVPALPDILRPEGKVSGQASLTWRSGGLPAFFESLSGQLTADGALVLALDPAVSSDIPPARLGQRILQAFVGDAASGLARISNLTAGVVRLLERLAGQSFALELNLQADQGRIDIGKADLLGSGLAAQALGWIDLADWQIDATWQLVFDAQGGEPYYRERRSGPLGAPDILRDGLLFRGATPPG